MTNSEVSPASLSEFMEKKYNLTTEQLKPVKNYFINLNTYWIIKEGQEFGSFNDKLIKEVQAHPELIPYFEMLQVGIDSETIIKQMIINNITEDLITLFDDIGGSIIKCLQLGQRSLSSNQSV